METETLKKEIEDKNKQLVELKCLNEKLINQITQQGVQIEGLTSKINDLIALNQNTTIKNAAQKRPHSTEKGASSKNQIGNQASGAKKKTTTENLATGNNQNYDVLANQTNETIEIDTDSGNEYNVFDIPAQFEITNDKWSDVVMREKGNISKKPTPIQLEKLTQEKSADIINKLFDQLNGKGWSQIKSNSSPRIQCDNKQTKDSIIQILNDNKIQHNTYAEKNQKKKAYIVRGLCHGFDENNELGIKNALNSIGNIEIYDIKRYLFVVPDL